MEKFGNNLPEDAQIARTGKSISVRKKVGEIPSPDTINQPEGYEETIEGALDAASDLLQWYIQEYRAEATT